MLVNCLHCFLWFCLYYLLHLLRSFRNSYKFIDCYLNTIWIYEFFKNHLRRGVFCNVKLSNLTNVLQSSLRTESTGECIFRVSGEQNFENFSTQWQPWWHLRGFDVCTSLPKKSLDTSLIYLCTPGQTLWFARIIEHTLES